MCCGLGICEGRDGPVFWEKVAGLLGPVGADDLKASLAVIRDVAGKVLDEELEVQALLEEHVEELRKEMLRINRGKNAVRGYSRSGGSHLGGYHENPYYYGVHYYLPFFLPFQHRSLPTKLKENCPWEKVAEDVEKMWRGWPIPPSAPDSSMLLGRFLPICPVPSLRGQVVRRKPTTPSVFQEG